MIVLRISKWKGSPNSYGFVSSVRSPPWPVSCISCFPKLSFFNCEYNSTSARWPIFLVPLGVNSQSSSPFRLTKPASSRISSICFNCSIVSLASSPKRSSSLSISMSSKSPPNCVRSICRSSSSISCICFINSIAADRSKSSSPLNG